jgi:hypothetical protein
MSGTDVAASTVFEQAMAVAVRRLTGAVIGKINAYDPTTERATVTSLVPILVSKDPANPANDVVDPVITLQQVPVEWPSSHNAAGVLQHSIKFPLPVGSFVSIEPKGHDHSQWFTSGVDEITPADDRRFSIADMVVRPMAPIPLATAPVNTESYDAAGAVLFGLWIVGGSSATEFVALATKVLTELNNVKNWADPHVHAAGAYTTAGGPVTGYSGVATDPLTALPKPMPAPGSVAATKLMAI